MPEFHYLGSGLSILSDPYVTCVTFQGRQNLLFSQKIGDIWVTKAVLQSDPYFDKKAKI